MRSDNQSPDQQDSVSNLDGIVLIALLFACCLAPLGLAALAFVSAWTSSLTAFNTFRPWLLAIAFY